MRIKVRELLLMRLWRLWRRSVGIDLTDVTFTCVLLGLHSTGVGTRLMSVKRSLMGRTSHLLLCELLLLQHNLLLLLLRLLLHQLLLLTVKPLLLHDGLVMHLFRL